LVSLANLHKKLQNVSKLHKKQSLVLLIMYYRTNGVKIPYRTFVVKPPFSRKHQRSTRNWTISLH